MALFGKCQLSGFLGILTLAVAPAVLATAPDRAEPPMRQFLSQPDTDITYRATRRLEAENGERKGWMEAVTEYSPAKGFTYHVTAEGGSGSIREKVLRAVLEGERAVIAQGEAARSALIKENYNFRANGIDDDGLANILVMPRRKDGVLVSGTLFLTAADGDLVRLQGRLAKSPSFWVKDVDIVRTYERLGGIVVPTSLQSTAQVRLLGSASLRMTYVYSEINGQVVN